MLADVGLEVRSSGYDRRLQVSSRFWANCRKAWALGRHAELFTASPDQIPDLRPRHAAQARLLRRAAIDAEKGPQRLASRGPFLASAGSPVRSLWTLCSLDCDEGTIGT